MDYSMLNCEEQGRDFVEILKTCELKKLRRNYAIIYGIIGLFISSLPSLATEWICYGVLYYYGFGFDGIRPESWADNRLKYGPIMYDDSWFACE